MEEFHMTSNAHFEVKLFETCIITIMQAQREKDYSTV